MLQEIDQRFVCPCPFVSCSFTVSLIDFFSSSWKVNSGIMLYDTLRGGIRVFHKRHFEKNERSTPASEA